MKVSFLENIMIGLLISILATLALGTTVLLHSYLHLLGDYQILIEALIFIIGFILFAAACVQILLKIGQFKKEEFAMLSARARLWKMLTTVSELGGTYFLPLVPLFLRPAFYSLFGVKTGKNVEVAGKLVEYGLIKIDDFAFIGGDTFITAHAIVHDKIILNPVSIGKKVTIGVGAIVMPGVEVGDNTVIAPGSVVTAGTKIPANEFWGGTPAKRLKSFNTNSKAAATKIQEIHPQNP